MLHFRIDARQILDGPHHEGEIRDEGLNAADGHDANFDLGTAVANDEPQRNSSDDLHGGEEERREPRRTIGCFIHLARQLLKLFRILILAQQGFHNLHR